MPMSDDGGEEKKAGSLPTPFFTLRQYHLLLNSALTSTQRSANPAQIGT
jgi:hypothetical protein